MGQSQQETADGRESQDSGAAADVTSDPAHGDADGNDWASEGGATPSGPATDVDAAASDETDE